MFISICWLLSITVWLILFEAGWPFCNTVKILFNCIVKDLEDFDKIWWQLFSNFPPLQHFYTPHTLAEMSVADSSSIMTGENSANVAKLAYATAEFPPT